MTYSLKTPNAVIIIEPLGKNAFKFITKEKRWTEMLGNHTIDGPATIQLADLVKLHDELGMLIKQARS